MWIQDEKVRDWPYPLTVMSRLTPVQWGASHPVRRAPSCLIICSEDEASSAIDEVGLGWVRPRRFPDSVFRERRCHVHTLGGSKSRRASRFLRGDNLAYFLGGSSQDFWVPSQVACLDSPSQR